MAFSLERAVIIRAMTPHEFQGGDGPDRDARYLSNRINRAEPLLAIVLRLLVRRFL
jgi:hypothetical protein